MAALDAFVPHARLREIDVVELGVPVAAAFAAIEALDFGELPIARALFALRAVPDTLAGRPSARESLRMSAFRTSEHGFRCLRVEPGRGYVVGAIGAVWKASIPFVDVASDAYAAYREPGQIKVAWELRADPRTERTSAISIEVRVEPTDDESWARFQRYFALIGPFSRLLRKLMLAHIRRSLGGPEPIESAMALPGDELVGRPLAEHTDAITIDAPPERVWPWLLQMGGDRAGWYAIDLLDHGGAPSAREIDPALQELRTGDILHAAPGAEDGFTVATIEPERALVLWGAVDLDADRPLALGAPLPAHHWRVSWSFVLAPIDGGGTRLLVRVRGDWAPERLVWRARIGLLAHHVMEHAQLARLKRRAEGTLPRDTTSDVIDGATGAARILYAIATPFLREERSHWGLDPVLAARRYPGDACVPEPRWSWTHAVEVDAAPSRVWPWVAQIGADRGGFYSYQFLENLAGCSLENADRIHQEWQRTARTAGAMILHPSMPPLPIVELEEGHHFVAHAPISPDDPDQATVSWLFLVEPLDAGRRSRVVSRFRSSYAGTLGARLRMGPALTEPIGFAMDRRMLLGIKDRAERK